MLAARCRDGCPTTGADCVAVSAPAIVITLAGSDVAAMAATVPTTRTAAASTSAAATLGDRRTYGQDNDSDSEHEHTECRHVACLPERRSGPRRGWLSVR